LSVLGGGGGEYDLLKGSGGASKVSKDPAPAEFDLLGGKAQEDAAVIKEVRCAVCGGSVARSREHRRVADKIVKNVYTTTPTRARSHPSPLYPSPHELTLLPSSPSPFPQDPYDVLLAELIFTTEDVRVVIYKRLDDCNAGFVEFLESRIGAATDLDERQALRSLVEMVDAVKKAVERKKVEDAARMKEEQQRQMEEEAKLMAEMAEAKKRAQTVQQTEAQRQSQREELQRLQGMGGGDAAAGAAGPGGAEAVVAMDSKQSYVQMLEALLGLDFGDAGYVREVVEANYERCTMEFLDLLGGRLIDAATPPDVLTRLVALKGHIEFILQERMSRAAERLQTIVKAGPVDAMLEKIYELNDRGEIDEPFILLLETNVQQAERAGAASAAEVFRKLVATAREAIDEKLTPSTRLVRRLLRVTDSGKRKEVLHDAFRPKATTLTAEGAKTEAMPDVPPPDFIEELRQLIKNFGNIETNDFGAMLRALVEEAEEVSTGIYGKAMSHREQQDYMWQKGSVSVFDLEALEGKAQAKGDQMPWQNDAYDSMMPPGFENGVRTIGGNDKNKF